MGLPFHYRALGLDIAAPFACSGLWPVEHATTGREIRLALGEVPQCLDNPVRDRPMLQIDAAGTALHRVPGIARYLMRERARVTIALEAGATLDRAIDFLKGTPLALLCHQWGLVPLEALCLARHGQALLLGAAAGSGKTTIALALAARGFRLMGDGLCALEATAGTQPMIWPGFAEVKAWPETLQALQLPLPPGDPNPGGRYTLAAQDWFDPLPHPVRAVAEWRPARGGVAERVVRRRGAAAFETVMNLQSLADAMRGLAREADPMLAVGRLAAQSPVFEAWTPSGFERLAELPGWLIEGLGLPDFRPVAASRSRQGTDAALCV